MTSAKVSSERLWLMVAAAAIVVFAVSLLPHPGSGAGVTPASARGAPRELSFRTIDGAQWRLSEHRGQVVAVNLWATWCGPCRAETPVLVHLAGDPALQGFRVIGVSLDHAANREDLVRSFIKAYGVPYPIAFPEAMSQMESGLDGIPTTLLFDRQGRAAKIYVGAMRETSLRADVTTLLRER